MRRRLCLVGVAFGLLLALIGLLWAIPTLGVAGAAWSAAMAGLAAYYGWLWVRSGQSD